MKGFSTLRKNGFSRLAGSYPLQIQTGGATRSQSCILLNLCTIYPYIRYWNIYVPFYLCTYRNCWHIYVPFYLCKLYTIRIQDICTCMYHTLLYKYKYWYIYVPYYGYKHKILVYLCTVLPVYKYKILVYLCTVLPVYKHKILVYLCTVLPVYKHKILVYLCTVLPV